MKFFTWTKSRNSNIKPLRQIANHNYQFHIPLYIKSTNHNRQ